eukprot:CAMPEP_0172320858 /NCGR_PEP_ID=MMETSP1058-20130122/41628_1 /TAXON_ID=83371 /ORGANISM="Detonula confervacea, Strain CCMP 353" /LENGTH=267 /DNA_ID=CAMNT_0013036215 /DNA_START=405 /DNA_END=1205 /DNA_ORIENTATION=+
MNPVMISVEQLYNCFFVLGVVAVAVIPRQPSDDRVRWWSIGGRLSHNFRKLLLVIAAVNFCRLFLSGDVPRKELETYQLGSDFLGVVEVTGLTFLCFLTPYVLQQGLSHFFHIIPGKSLKFPLCLAALLSFLGIFLSRTVHPNFWALKKLANAVSGPPVISTLRSYNSFTTAQSHGRGFVFAQTVIVIEYWHLILQLCCAAAYALNRDTIGTDEETLSDRIMKATRSIAFVTAWTRVLVHAMFMNQLDEMYHTTDFTADVDDEENNN